MIYTNIYFISLALKSYFIVLYVTIYYYEFLVLGQCLYVLS